MGKKEGIADSERFDVEIRASVRHTVSILNSGVKNLHQVGHSNGDEVPELRAEIENDIIGLKLESKYNPSPDNPFHALRPKYGHLVPPLRGEPAGASRESRVYYSLNPSLGKYGCIGFLLRQDAEKRTTWTFTDSLNIKTKFTPQDSIGEREFRSIVNTFYLNRPSRVVERGYRRFFEAQVWGPVEADDMDAIVIPADPERHCRPAEFAGGRFNEREWHALKDAIRASGVRAYEHFADADALPDAATFDPESSNECEVRPLSMQREQR